HYIGAPALIEGGMREQFFAAYRRGAELLAAGDATEFRRLMVEFAGGDASSVRWVCKLALCQGLLAKAGPAAGMSGDYERVRQFAGPDDDAITKYAAAAELDRFVVAGAVGAEYEVSHGGERRTYRKSRCTIVTSVDRRGRPRITVPFSLFG